MKADYPAVLILSRWDQVNDRILVFEDGKLLKSDRDVDMRLATYLHLDMLAGPGAAKYTFTLASLPDVERIKVERQAALEDTVSFAKPHVAGLLNERGTVSAGDTTAPEAPQEEPLHTQNTTEQAEAQLCPLCDYPLHYGPVVVAGGKEWHQDCFDEQPLPPHLPVPDALPF